MEQFSHKSTLFVCGGINLIATLHQDFLERMLIFMIILKQGAQLKVPMLKLILDQVHQLKVLQETMQDDQQHQHLDNLPMQDPTQVLRIKDILQMHLLQDIHQMYQLLDTHQMHLLQVIHQMHLLPDTQGNVYCLNIVFLFIFSFTILRK